MELSVERMFQAEEATNEKAVHRSTPKVSEEVPGGQCGWENSYFREYQ